MLISVIISGLLILKVYNDGLQNWAIGLIGLLIFLCVSHLSVALVNWLATLVLTPSLLPRLDFSKGIPREYRTLVVVPTMITSIHGINDLITALEVRFLGNRDAHIHFGLLTDFSDADEETLPEDDLLLQHAKQRIEELNLKYPGQSSNGFFLFHRSRRWNTQAHRWMGYERKRGKLADLNNFLRGKVKNCFMLVVGNTEVLSGVKFVITLDTDTQLARDSVYQYVGAMAHPLNRVCYDVTKMRVISGYGILQPRIDVSLAGINRSLYARLGTLDPGIDPYTHAVSDVYQDLFGEGSFIGKGIYDVDSYEQTLSKRFPDNRILSHDLLEGCYIRAGFLSDVPLYEDYPVSYSADIKRRHRWTRGDWQIAQWMMLSVPDNDLQLRKNPLSILSRWKIADNLRRSLIPAALTLLLLVGWTLLAQFWFWTLTVIGIVFIPSMISSTLSILRKPEDVTLVQHLIATMHSVRWHLIQAAFVFACLPYEGYVNLDAILRSNWRMFVSHQHLLEWTPSGTPDNVEKHILINLFKMMWFAPALSIALSIFLACRQPVILSFAGPVLLLWFLSPVIAWFISRPIAPYDTKLTVEQENFLRRAACKTWSFFETFVGPEDHWLPPDNFQEHPVAIIAHRTSPTNMGLALLANLSAFDFGFISAGKLIERTAQTLHTMEGLERYYGHFYNWYDTQSLKPLPPFYISSVDSGNLAGHLLTLRPGLLELIDQKIIGKRLWESLRDSIEILIDIAEKTPDFILTDKFTKLRQHLESIVHSQPDTLTKSRFYLENLAESSMELIAGIEKSDSQGELRWQVCSFAGQCRDALYELDQFAPWVEILSSSLYQSSFPDLDKIATLREIALMETCVPPKSEEETNHDSAPDKYSWLIKLNQNIAIANQRATIRVNTIKRLSELCEQLSQMEYGFLYDKTRHLLAIGYNVSELRLDTSYYDLLASEARFACFVAIAQGQLPKESWFALGRLLTTTGGEPILLSWSGSMFEYLMPLLIMPTYPHTLLDQTYLTAVDRQIEYGKIHSVPWGISESGYNAIDVQLNYQYRAFGVPGLGLKRGLSEDLVIAPYASMLALMVNPGEACLNLNRLATIGMSSRYGFYEAIDYTPSRLPHGQQFVMVQSFMTHHQGMSLLSLAYLLLDRPMQRRFESYPLFRATMLLLQERIPQATAFYARTTELSELRLSTNALDIPIRIFADPNTNNPEVHLLSNGRYHVMLTQAGGGYSRWKDIAVTRWHEDRTCDDWGMFCYLRDINSGEFWSASYQPVIKHAKQYETIFSEGMVEFRCRNLDYDTHVKIAVSSEDDIELRRLLVTNRSRTSRSIEITSYAEVVLTQQDADALHPAFSNLFVQTEIIHRKQAIICTRRPRSKEENEPWMFHMMTIHGTVLDGISYETDRMKFIGRENTLVFPQAMKGDIKGELSGSEGSVLDPIVSIRCRITLGAEESVLINMVSGIGETRDEVLQLINKYQDRRLANRVFDLAWTHSQVLLRQLNAVETDAQLFGRLASSIIYANASLRADASILIKNRRGQSGLWGYAISGDLPIVLLQIQDPVNIELVRQLVQAHAYWRIKGLKVDLVIWNEDRAGYRQLLHDQIMGLITAGIEANIADQTGGIFVRSAEYISEEDRILIETVARVIISDRKGSLSDQISGRILPEIIVPMLEPTLSHRFKIKKTPLMTRDDLIFYNGLGGFTPDGREYIITTTQENVTPAPWVNVLANPQFGTVVSETGMAYTWGENAHEYRLTPWSNDPVKDSRGEAFYLRDEESGIVWSPSPLPCRGSSPYITRHGFGYTVFEHSEHNITSELWVFVAMEAAVKFTILKVRNLSLHTRHLSATGYVEWVLGDLRSKSSIYILTEIDPDSGALLASNPYNTEFSNRTAFFDVDNPNRSVTGDRKEFLGRNGALHAPAALKRKSLSGKTGISLDPCGAIQVKFDLLAGEEYEIVFRLGLGRDLEDAKKLINLYKGKIAAYDALEITWHHWKHTLGAVNVETPDLSLNFLANGWLLYQTIACRMMARTATYQSGGAFGFRDQLQDVMALIHARPKLLRDHLLLCASRQFPEGDVQHWWHPPTGRGVRTHCSDDYLWLPFATNRYVLITGDAEILNESVSFIQGRPVNADEDSYYDLPTCSEETASLYQHCVRAIKKGLNFGEHGLPLIGSGDWNDGMNLVGIQGKGESVWLGFFLYKVLRDFSKVATLHGDNSFANRCIIEAEVLRSNIEKNAWDGEWYLRAFFDDGTPLGSLNNPECQIDSIAQSWSVLSGADNLIRSHSAMEALDRRLVNRKHKLIQLLDPPFDKSNMNPGYIQGYVPGVRENGGQYTHAAIWAVMAFSGLGNNQRAWELFSMINPVNHALTRVEAETYKVEPYVVAADIYAVTPHSGRGGWTWYSGSASWMYQLIIESLLGLFLKVDRLYFSPCLPADWKEFKLHYRFRETVYHITIIQISDSKAKMRVVADGYEQADNAIPLTDDHKEHWAEVIIPVPYIRIVRQ